MKNIFRFIDDFVNNVRKDKKKIASRTELVDYLQSTSWMDRLKESSNNMEVAITNLYKILIHPNAQI